MNQQKKICIEIFYRMNRSEIFNRFITTHTLVRLHSARLYSDAFLLLLFHCFYGFSVCYLFITHKKKWSNDDKEASLCLLFKQIVTVYHFWRWFAIKYISFRFSHSFDSINVQRINGTEFTGILKCTVSSTQFFWSGIFRFKAVFNRILHVFFKGFWWKRLSY